MAELTHLNEASVVHNLQTRYQADLIYVCLTDLQAFSYVLIVPTDLLWLVPRHSQSILLTTNIYR